MSHELRRTRLPVGAVFLVIFVLVSAGPFGIEEMVSATGPGMALGLLLVIDVFLFVMSYLLIFVASVALRVRGPDLARPFRVAVGTLGFVPLAGVPTAAGKDGASARPELSVALVRAAVEAAGGNQSEAARRLRCHRNTIGGYLRKSR
jgi:hypothetical protein